MCQYLALTYTYMGNVEPTQSTHLCLYEQPQTFVNKIRTQIIYVNLKIMGHFGEMDVYLEYISFG